MVIFESLKIFIMHIAHALIYSIILSTWIQFEVKWSGAPEYKLEELQIFIFLYDD